MNFPTQQQSNYQPAFGTRQTRVWWLTILVLILLARAAWGQTPPSANASLIGPVTPFNITPTNTAALVAGFSPFKLNLGVEGSQQPQDVDVAIKACEEEIVLAMYGWSAFASIFSHTGAMMKYVMNSESPMMI